LYASREFGFVSHFLLFCELTIVAIIDRYQPAGLDANKSEPRTILPGDDRQGYVWFIKEILVLSAAFEVGPLDVTSESSNRISGVFLFAILSVGQPLLWFLGLGGCDHVPTGLI